MRGPLSVELARLFQFSWVPEPKVILDVAEQILMALPGNLLSEYIFEFCSRLRMRLPEQSRPAIFELRIRRTPISRSTKIKLIVEDEDEFRRAMQEIPEILRAESQAMYWDKSDQRWRGIGSRDKDSDQ